MALDSGEYRSGGRVFDQDGLPLVKVANPEDIAGGGGGGGLTDAELRATPVDVDVVSALPAGTNNIGDVDIASALPAGDNNIGNVDLASAIPAGTNNIGDVDIASALPAGNNNIGDVDVASIAAGTNAIGNVGIVPRTTGGVSIFHLVSAASTNATNIKSSAGQVFGWYIYNSNAAARKVAFHNTAGTPTAGSGVVSSLVIPPTGAANVSFPMGIAFSTGIAITTVTDLTAAGNTAVGASDLIINIYFA